MRYQIVKTLIIRSFVFAIPLIFLCLSISGQKAAAALGCQETDYNCQIAKISNEIKLNPKNATAYYERGIIYSVLNNFDEAMKDFARAINLNPQFDKPYSGRGYINAQNKLYAEAIIDFKRANELNPADSFASEYLKYIYKVIKKGDLTIEQYDRLIELEPNIADYYYRRAKLYFKDNYFEKAAEDSSKAFELAPKLIDALAVRSDSYCKIGKWQEATADINTYEKLTGRTTGAVCYLYLDKNLKYCGETDDNCKIKIYNNGINNPQLIASPGLGDFYAGRGIIYFQQGDLEVAYSDFDNADKYKYGSKDKNIALYLGNKYLSKGKYDESLGYFKSAIPEAEAHLGIGEIYLNKRDFDKAFENFDRAIFLNTGLAKAYLGRGTVYFERGKNYEAENDSAKATENYKKAVKDFEKVTETDLKETNSEVYLRRSKVYEKLGEQKKAETDRAKYQELSERP